MARKPKAPTAPEAINTTLGVEVVTRPILEATPGSSIIPSPTQDDSLVKVDDQYMWETVAMHRKLELLFARTLPDICAIGLRLTAIKAHLGHGKFLPWVEGMKISERA